MTQPSPHQTDQSTSRFTGWRRQVGAVWIGQLFSVIGMSLIVPFLPLHLRDLGIRDVRDLAIWTGALVGVAPFCGAITGPLWGMLGDRFGQKPMVVRAQLASGITVGLMALAPDPLALLLLRIAQGLFGGHVGPTAALAAAVSPPTKIAFSLGLIQMAIFVGGIMGPLVGGVLADAIGVGRTFLITAVVMTVAAISITVLVHAPNSVPRDTPSPSPVGQSTSAIRLLFAVAVIGFAINLSNGAIQPVLPIAVQLFADTTSIATMTGALFGVTAATGAISAVIIGQLGDRVSARGLLIVSLIGGAVSFVPQALASSSLQLMAGRGLLGLFLGGGLSSVNAVAARLGGPARQGTAIGAVNSMALFGLGCGPPVGAALVATFGIAAPFWVIGGILAVTGLWAAITLRSLEAPLQEEGNERNQLR